MDLQAHFGPISDDAVRAGASTPERSRIPSVPFGERTLPVSASGIVKLFTIYDVTIAPGVTGFREIRKKEPARLSPERVPGLRRSSWEWSSSQRKEALRLGGEAS